jgi:hypothetical protein
LSTWERPEHLGDFEPSITGGCFLAGDGAARGNVLDDIGDLLLIGSGSTNGQMAQGEPGY